MPLPSTAATITGGCSCGAIRYRIDVPDESSRPLSPVFCPNDLPIKMPNVMTCHCNDCRRATTSLLPSVVVQVPSPMLTVSALSPSSDGEPNQITGRIMDVLAADFDVVDADANRPPYRPAMDVLRALGTNESWLRYFHTQDCGLQWSRSFCGRCGSQICYHLRLLPMMCKGGKVPEDFGDIFDLYAGSVDKEFLDKGWIEPKNEIQFDNGSHMGRIVSTTASGLKHLPKLKHFSGDEDGIVDGKQLQRLAAGSSD